MNVVEFGIKILAMSCVLGLRREDWELYPRDQDSLPVGLCPDPYEVFWAEFLAKNPAQRHRIMRCASMAGLLSVEEGRVVVVRPLRDRAKLA